MTGPQESIDSQNNIADDNCTDLQGLRPDEIFKQVEDYIDSCRYNDSYCFVAHN